MNWVHALLKFTILTSLIFVLDACKKNTPKSELDQIQGCRKPMQSINWSNRSVTIPKELPYAFLRKDSLAAGAVKEVFPAVDVSSDRKLVIGLPHCAKDRSCDIKAIMEEFEKERLLDDVMIGKNGTLVDVFKTEDDIPVIVKEFAHGDTIKKLIQNDAWNPVTRTMKVGEIEVSGDDFKKAMWDMIVSISVRPLKQNDSEVNLDEYLSIAGYSEEIAQDSSSLAVFIKDLNPANVIAQVDEGKLVFKIVDGNASLGKNFSSSDTSAYLEVVRENTWEVIRNLEATRLFGMLPKPVLNWSESQIPGIKNVPPSNNAMAIFMADLRNFLWKQQQELAADLSKQKTAAP